MPTGRRAAVLVVAMGAAASVGLASIFADGFEVGAPSWWSVAAGWTCPDGLAPTTGSFLVEEPGTDGCPPGMLLVDTFCIDRFEASLAEVLPGGELAPWSPFLGTGAAAGHTLRALSVRSATPQGYVNQITANAACEAAGKRLCTDAEWLRACRGPSAFTYPWGNDAQAGRCNDFRAVSPVVEYYGTNASWVWSHLDQPCLNQLPASLERAGARPGCASAEGALDMMGNILEWTADPSGTLRGGSYVDTQINGAGCTYTTTAHSTSHWAYDTGFRCCAAPP